MTQLRNGLALLLVASVGVRLALALLQPLLVPAAVLLVLVVAGELLVSRRRRW